MMLSSSDKEAEPKMLTQDPLNGDSWKSSPESHIMDTLWGGASLENKRPISKLTRPGASESSDMHSPSYSTILCIDWTQAPAACETCYVWITHIP